MDEDLAAALKEGIIAGASLDVFRTEPLPPENPLWDAPNLIITPLTRPFRLCTCPGQWGFSAKT